MIPVLKNKNILIIEDNPADAHMIQELLEHTGSGQFEIFQADSLALGMEFIQKNSVDVVLLDLSLPDSQGFETILNFQERYPSVPIVVLSGLNNEEISFQAVREGAQDYIVKGSINGESLARSIRYAVERKKGEKEIRTLAKFPNENPSPMMRISLNGTLLYANPASYPFLESYRCEVGKVFNTPFFKSYKENFNAKSTVQMELESNGRVFQMTFSPVPESNYINLYGVDVTDRKKAEKQLGKALEGLKKIDKMKSEFVSNASHELRTPLTSIKNALELLMNGKTGKFGKDQERFLAIACRNTARLTKMINDLLDLSKIESGRMPFRFSEFSIFSVIQAMVESFQPQGQTKKIGIDMDVQDDLPPVYADSLRIEQVIGNLISNALKFTPEGGRISISGRNKGEYIEIGVCDTGFGISPEDLPSVFDRFFQSSSNQLTQDERGTGLGLSITKQLVENCGGRIRAESQAGIGSRFYFSLPIYSPEAIEKARLDETLRQYKTYPTFSMIVIKVYLEDANGRVCEDLSTVNSFLNQFSGTVRFFLPRLTDLIAIQPVMGCLTIVLPGTPKTGAEVVKRKLYDCLISGNPSNHSSTINSFSILGPATFPENGDTGWDLLGFALQSNIVKRKLYEPEKPPCG